MEAPLHPTPMARPMMKGKIYIDASNKPTFQGIWGMTHADVNKGGHTNDFKVVRMESVRQEEVGLPVFPGKYIGYFRLSTGFTNETVPENFTLTFRGHSNHGYNVYGSGENKFGKNEIVGTVTQSGKMEIFKMLPGTTVQPDPNEVPPPLPRPANPRAVSPPPPSSLAKPLSAGGPAKAGIGGGTPRPKNNPKKKTPKAKRTPEPPPSKNGLPGVHVRTLKDCLLMLKKTDKNNVFQFPVPPHFRGFRGVYSEVIKNPMDLGTVFKQIDTKYRTVEECIADVRLVFSNAKEYNPDTDPVHALAASLSGKFEAFVSNHKTSLGLDGPGQGSPAPGNKPPVAASMAVSSSAGAVAGGGGVAGGNAAAKRVSTPPPGAGTVGGVKDKDPASTVSVLTAGEQEQLARDVNELFRVGNTCPSNERAQARVYALWSFAKAYVQDKDRVTVDGGKASEIRMDALNHVRQRQLRDIVSFFMEDSKNDPIPDPDPAPTVTSSTSNADGKDKIKLEQDKDNTMKDRTSGGGGGDGEGAGAISPASGRPGKRPRSDRSDSEDDAEEEEEAEDEDDDEDGEGSEFPNKRSRGSGESQDGEGQGDSRDDGGEREVGSGDPPSAGDEGSGSASRFDRVDSSSLTLEATASTLKEAEINIDLDEDEDEDEEDEADDAGGKGSGLGSGNEVAGDGGGGSSKVGKMDAQWLQAQAERKEREEREKARAASEKALEEQRLRHQAQREKERVEEGLKLSRERAAEKARLEAAALEKANREKKELEDKKEAERLAREGTKASVDLDQVRADSQLMDLMDESIYDD